MKKTTYIGKKREDLVKALNEKRLALQTSRFGTAGSKTRNTRESHTVRKDIARIMTELHKTK